jgi:prefoldin subunit 5
MSSALEQYESSTPASVESPVTVVDNSEELENLKKQIGYLSDQKRELIASKNALAKALEASESKSAVEVHVDAEAVSSGKEDELTKEIGYLKDRIRELVSVKNSMSSALEQYESATPAPAESSVSVVDNSEELENLKKQIGYLSDQKRELIASKNALAKALEASESKPAVEVHVDADAISSGKEDELTKEIGYLKDRIRELVSVKNSMASALEQYESSTPAPAESSVTVVDNSEELENLKKQIGYLSNQKRELIASKNALAKALEAVEAKL